MAIKRILYCTALGNSHVTRKLTDLTGHSPDSSKATVNRGLSKNEFKFELQNYLIYWSSNILKSISYTTVATGHLLAYCFKPSRKRSGLVWNIKSGDWSRPSNDQCSYCNRTRNQAINSQVVQTTSRSHAGILFCRTRNGVRVDKIDILTSFLLSFCWVLFN